MTMENRDLGYLIKSIHDKLKVHADADLKSHNLTLTQSRVLGFLNQKGGQTTQKEIEVFLGVAHPTVVGIVSRMEQNGHVTTWLDPRDRRSKIVRLTDSSRAIGADMDRRIRESEQNLLRGLSPQEAEMLRDMLVRIVRNLE